MDLQSPMDSGTRAGFRVWSGKDSCRVGLFDLTLVMGHSEFGIFGRFGNSRSSLVRLIEVLYVHLSFLFFLYLHLLGNKRSPRAQLCSVSYIT